MKNCLARPIRSRSAFSASLALSGFTVSVCREVYTNHLHTSSIFLKNFAFFCKKISKTLKNQCFQKSLFWHFFKKAEILAKKCERNASLTQQIPKKRTPSTIIIPIYSVKWVLSPQIPCSAISDITAYVPYIRLSYGAPVRGDCVLAPCFFEVVVSIHAPARGRPGFAPGERAAMLFQFAPP